MFKKLQLGLEDIEMVEQQCPKAEEIRRAVFGGAGVCRAHRNIKSSLAWFLMEGELAALILAV